MKRRPRAGSRVYSSARRLRGWRFAARWGTVWPQALMEQRIMSVQAVRSLGGHRPARSRASALASVLNHVADFSRTRPCDRIVCRLWLSFLAVGPYFIDTTRASLLLRIRDARDTHAWAEFDAIYRPMLAASRGPEVWPTRRRKILVAYSTQY